MMDAGEVISAARRSERARSELLAEFEHCEFGDAYRSRDFRDVVEANMLHDVWLDQLDGDTVFDAAETVYAAGNTTCRAWMPATIQPIEDIQPLLSSRGWQKHDLAAAYLSNAWLFDEPTPGPLKILPARAMRRAYRATFADSGNNADAQVDAAFARLDAASFNAVVAMRGDEPLGRAAYLEVGDIARVMDVHVVPAARRQGVGRAMIAHLLQLARRLLPRIVVVCPPFNDTRTAAFFGHCGFVASGKITQFIRPAE